MSRAELYKLDLNLLKVFIALIEEGSVTGAGERLGLAQSSISHALGRLRRTFGNPLFVRTTIGMRPTPFAMSMVGPVTGMLDELQSVLERSQPFHPATSTREFRLLMPDIVEFLLMPRLLRLIDQNGYSVKVLSNRHPLGTHQPLRTYREALEAGQADLAIAVLPETHRNFVQRLLFEDPQVCMMSHDNPLRHKLTLERYLMARHLVVDTPAIADSLLRKALGNQAHRRQVVIAAPNYLVAPFAISGTDIVAVLPKAIADIFAEAAGLVSMPPPFKMPATSVRIFWHRAMHDDPGCQWLRTTIAGLFPRRAGLDRLAPVHTTNRPRG